MADPVMLTVGIAVAVAALFGVVLLISKRVVRVPPDQAFVIVGRSSNVENEQGEQYRAEYTILKGGRTFVKPVVEEVKTLPLETFTVPVNVAEVITESGVPLMVQVISQVKVKSDTNGLATAAEQLLDKSNEEIQDIARKNLEGHIRSACAKMQVEAINNDRVMLGNKVQEEAVPDLARLGLELTTFTVKDIGDDVGYLQALGEKRTAEVIRDAEIGKAEAERDAQVKVAEAKRDQEAATAEAIQRDLRIREMEAKRDGETEAAERAAEIAEAEAQRDVRIEDARAEEERARAIADLAHQIQTANTGQQLADEEKELKIRQAEVEEQDQRISVVVPAEQQANARRAEAEGRRDATILEAEGDAQEIRQEGEAEADVIFLKGQAEAQALELVAGAYENFNEAAIVDRIVEKLPEIAEAFAKPLEGVEKVVILDGGGGGGMGGNSLAQWMNDGMVKIPEFVEAFTGKDISEVFGEAVDIAKHGNAGAIEPPAE